MADSRPLNPAPCDIRPVDPEQTFAGRFTGRTLLITGGARGIGRATALRAAREGANVVVADCLAAEGQQTLADIHAGGGRAIFVPVDVLRNDDCQRMVASATWFLPPFTRLVTSTGSE